uniref:Cytochrome P450 n=1 Tax=Anopheles farauti TaxID=69004 RepID=A0A182Q486_9DIPT
MSIQLILIALATLALACILWKRRKLYAAAATMNGPLALPIVGQLYLIFGKKRGDDFLKVFNRYAPHYNSPVGVWLGPMLVVGINNNPDHFQTVLNSPHMLNKTYHYSFFRVGRGLFAAPGL